VFLDFPSFSSTRKTRSTEVPFPHIEQGSFSVIRTLRSAPGFAVLAAFFAPLFTGNVTPS
jgi:hypothetical protein